MKSIKNGKRYVGYTSKDAETRLKEHNTGCNKFTKNNGPFDICHTKNFHDKKSAMQKEKFLKSGQGRKFLDSMGL